MNKAVLTSVKFGLGIKRAAAAGMSLACLGLLGTTAPAYAVTSLKQVQISNGSQIDLLFDGKVQKSQIRTEFLNDIIQLSIQDVSVYPAKISSVNGGSLTKIFAYQYAPKLVRCRLTVKGKAEDYKSRFEIKANGRILTVKMDAGDSSPAAKASVTSHQQAVTTGSEPDAEERALLSRVMAAAGPQAPGQIPVTIAGKTKEAAPAAVPAEKTTKDAITLSAAAPAAVSSSEGAPSTENLPVHLSGEAPGKLTSAKPLPSPLKALGKLGLVLGLFGIFAFALKRFAQGRTDSRLSDPKRLSEAAGKSGWLGALGRMAKKGMGREGRMIEVLSTHYLGPKKSIAVVRVAGRVLVLGVSNESINLITQLSGEDAAEQLGSLGMEDLGLGDFAAPKAQASLSPRSAARPAPAKPATGATAAGGAIFADLLHSERAKPAFANPSGSAAYAGVAESSKNGNPNVRAQIRNRLEGLKQL